MAFIDLKIVRYTLLGFTCLITSCTATLDEKYRNKLYTMSEVPIAKIPISPPLEKRTIMTPGRNLLHNTAKKQEYFSGINERKKMYMLEGKKSRNPQKNKKNKQRVQEEYKKLYAKREQRIGWKIDFLQSFYRDLYLLQPEKFNKKYKRHCSDELSSTLKTLYKQRHNGLKGNYWYLFGDNAIHGQEEIKIANIKYADHDKEGIKEYHSCTVTREVGKEIPFHTVTVIHGGIKYSWEQIQL